MRGLFLRAAHTVDAVKRLKILRSCKTYRNRWRGSTSYGGKWTRARRRVCDENICTTRRVNKLPDNVLPCEFVVNVDILDWSVPVDELYAVTKAGDTIPQDLQRAHKVRPHHDLFAASSELGNQGKKRFDLSRQLRWQNFLLDWCSKRLPSWATPTFRIRRNLEANHILLTLIVCEKPLFGLDAKQRRSIDGCIRAGFDRVRERRDKHARAEAAEASEKGGEKNRREGRI